MRLQVVSDLHLEFLGYNPDALGLEVVSGVDVLVLAGDVMNWRNSMLVRETMEWFAKRAELVIYVPGNHEYYGSSPSQADAVMANAALCGPTNVEYALEPLKLRFKKRRFLCGTGWYSRAAVESIKGDPDTGTFWDGRGQYRFSDFYHIKDLSPWVYQQNEAMSALLERWLRRRDVVVTHHTPAPQSIPAQFRGAPDNVFYMHNYENLIGKRHPALWLHGHTHTPFDYRLGPTRVVCNPRGYRAERTKLGSFTPVVIDL